MPFCFKGTALETRPQVYHKHSGSQKRKINGLAKNRKYPDKFGLLPIRPPFASSFRTAEESLRAGITNEAAHPKNHKHSFPSQ